jgi:DNA-binding transcriptional MerR regulator
LVAKAAEAFRTIGEVAEELGVPKHVLRFWELKFPQIRPMKRGGGRRYYRPEDIWLLRGIRHLLHQEGYTIKGVQRILREEGIDRVKQAAASAAKGAGAESGAAAPPVAREEPPAAPAGRRASGAGAASNAQRKVIMGVLAELERLRARLTAAEPAQAGAAPPVKARRSRR